MVRERDGAACFRCGCGGALDLHHRQRRREGGHGVSNLLSLCPLCHRWVHAHPVEARAAGWIVSVHEDKDPTQMPVRHFTGDQVLLDDEGGIRWLPTGRWGPGPS